MKWYLFIGSLAVIGIGFVVIWFLPTPPPSNQGDQTGTLPVASSTNSQGTGGFQTGTTAQNLELGVQGGGSLTVSDFIHNKETIPDVVNPGSYVLAGSLGYCLADGSCPKAYDTSDFQIAFNSKTQFFTIALLAEPVGEVRTEAEQFFLSRLGITQTQACSLNYVLGVAATLNDFYSGKNLGFSFCKGATVLPQ